MSKRPHAQPHAQLRQSQLLTTFGPGAMVDLPNYSVIISGLNHWSGDRQRIFEDRLASKISEKLDVKNIILYTPPVDNNADPNSMSANGISAFVFPTWFLAQVDQTIRRGSQDYRTRPFVKWDAIQRGRVKFDRQSVSVVPVRFVQACVNGHISDIDWYSFVHDSFKSSCRGQLWLDEGGSGSDFADIFVRCEACKKLRPLSDATIPNHGVLGKCQGDRPWLGFAAKQDCRAQEIDKKGNFHPTERPEYNRLLVRSASNAYFPQILSVISLPDSDAVLKQVVDRFYDEDLQYLEDIDELKKELRKPKYTDLTKFDLDIVWQEIDRRRGGLRTPAKTIKQVEIETLLSDHQQVGKDELESDFYARVWEVENLDRMLSKRIERIVLVDRLREVMAQLGFTRFEAAMTDIEGELSIPVKRADLDIDTQWVPAIETRGEGVFIAFQKDVIEKWQKTDTVQQRGKTLLRGFERWRDNRGLTEKEVKFPGLPYIMLHSLSHLLIQGVSLECGYAASAIRERIYAGDAGYGILFYTGTSGSEGTLGGLIEVGKNIEHHLLSALELGRLCSNDPVCAQHNPYSEQEDRLLHGSACHGCLLIAETSCERSNEFLDRALVVGTVEDLGAEFFP